MKCSIRVILALTMLAACTSGRSNQLPTRPVVTPTSSISSPPPEPILGTWRSVYTCERFVRAFERAGVGELAAKGLVAFRMQHGPVARLASSSDVCAGAKNIQRTQIFHPNGYLLRYQGKEVADKCRCYELIGGHTFIVLGDPGEPDMTLHYQIDAGTLTFQVVTPDQCFSARCRDQFAFAVGQYAVGPWQRVS